MKRCDQLLELISKKPQGATAPDMAASLATKATSIWTPLQDLVERKLIVSDMGNPRTYTITPAGAEFVASDAFGKAAQAGPAQKSPTDSESDRLSFGIFSSGEMHIRVNGKTISLDRSQTRQLVDFLDALPDRIFSGEMKEPRPTMATLPSRVVRHD